jgi:hypothetical protein
VIKAAGIDLSLTGTGAVLVPGPWDLRWHAVERASFGVSLPRTAALREVTHRLRDVSRDVVRWIVRQGATHVFVEDLPPHAKGFSMVPLAELRGVFRCELLEQAGLDAVFVNQSSARKFLLGKLPPKDRKAHVVEALKAAGADFEDSDQYDAFCSVNLRLGELGVPHLQELLFKFDEPKVKRPRARKAAA